MKVCGLNRSTSPPSLPSEAWREKGWRQAGESCAAAIASTAMKPTLWRLSAYCAPGLPRPTKSFIASSSSQRAGRAAPEDIARDVKKLFLLLVLLLFFLGLLFGGGGLGGSGRPPALRRRGRHL